MKAVDRKIIGQAAAYPADANLRARQDELDRSQRRRREVAWETVAKVLEPVALAESRLRDAAGGVPVVPRWRTWYGSDDFERMFKKLYADLGPDGRRQRRAFSAQALDAIFPWNARAVDELPDWPEARYLDYLTRFKDALDFGGAGGNARVSYGPAVPRHLFENYARLLSCLEGPEPDPLAGGAEGPAATVRLFEQGTVAACEWVEYGPFPVADGAALTARLRGTGDADLYLRAGAAPTSWLYDCSSRGPGSNESCRIQGPALVWAGVGGYAPASAFELAVEYGQAEADNFSSCFEREFPAHAATVKAFWRRAQFGQTLPTYDTSAARMETRLRPDGAADWGPGDGQAVPGPDQIYTVRLPNESASEYRLAALHIATKELRHWMWITLWWSPDPDSDFGADRPPAIQGLGPPWSNYKMCVVTSFVEGDSDAAGGFDASAPALAEALRVVHAGAGGPSWCSNPYLEDGPGNARTNCIGCHQHAGTSLTVPAVLGDAERFPHNGRSRVRNNFPSDYLWSVNQGDALGRVVEAEVQYYDSP